MSDLTLWEVFVRENSGVAHRHAGSVQAGNCAAALHAARNVFTRRGACASLWVVPSEAIATSGEAEPEAWFVNPQGKPFRSPDHYEVPKGVTHL